MPSRVLGLDRQIPATIVEVPASHVSFVSQPEAATQLIPRAVEAVSRAEPGSD